jgi:23S rRNA G2445 N2-methylase RlmL
LRYARWDRKSPLADPLCGSATLLVEAGLWSKNVAPGLTRQRFGFERWANFDAAARDVLAELRAEARAAALPEPAPLFGRDASPEALALARSSLRRAGLTAALEVGALRDASFETAGAIVANPPYGKRLERSDDLARELARLVDRHQDAHVALLLASEQPIGRTHRRPAPPREVFNGNLSCVVRSWERR